MSYTPEEQLLDTPLYELGEVVKRVREAMLERLRHPEEWRAEHREELRDWVKRLTDLEIDAVNLRSEVR